MSLEIVAELSGSHGGSLDNALRLIDAARKGGADSVKFQCFDPVRLARKREGVMWEGKKQSASDLLALYSKTRTPKHWFPGLIARCIDNRISWFSSVFHPDDVAFLETLNCPRYKISAYEMLDGDLINAVVKTGKPIVMSVRPREGVTVLLATDYAADGKWQTGIGLSDHTLNNTVSAHMAAVNAPMIERHIRLPGVETPDSAFSLDPDQFKEFVRVCREAANPAPTDPRDPRCRFSIRIVTM